MADNLAVTPGNGAIAAADEVTYGGSSTALMQAVKIFDGTAGSVNPWAISANGAASVRVVTQGTPKGYQQITSLSGSTGLTVPSGATSALIQAEAVDVRWRDDGTNPTSTVGMILPSGLPQTFSGDLSVLQFIQTSGGSAILNISYYA